MTGYEYGNTRLRVRASRMFDELGYQTLLTVADVDGLLGALAYSPYGPDVEKALGRYSGLRRLDEAVRTHLSAQLADVLTFYDGEIKASLRLYESRWDIRNLRSILRSLAYPDPGQEPALLVAAGGLDEAALSEIAAQRDVRSAVDLLSVWNMPSRAAVRHLRNAMASYAQTGDTAAFETALDKSLAEMVTRAASCSEPSLLGLLQAEVDQLNLMASLRRRGALTTNGRADSFSPIPGGRIRESAWKRLAETIDRQEAATYLAELVPPDWQPAVSAWEGDGDLAALEGSLEDAARQVAIRRFRRGDPLGIDIPLGFIRRKEAEAANLRLIGRAIAHGLSRDEVAAKIVAVT